MSTKLEDIKLVAPSAELVSANDPRVQAWKNSRPTFDHSGLDIEAVNTMDLSLNSMANYTLFIKSSVAFRDFMLTLRPIAPWAQSFRSAPLTSDFLMVADEGVQGGYDCNTIVDTLNAIELGEHQDVARDGLSMSLLTQFTVTIDHRTLVGFLKSMREVDGDLYGIYAPLLLGAIGKDEEWLESQATRSFQDAYLISDNERTAQTGTVGDVTFSRFVTTYSHAAQMLRMHHCQVKTGIWNTADTYGWRDVVLDTQGDLIDVIVYSNASAWTRMCKLRSHWFANWRTWGPVVSDTISDMTTEEFWEFLPNGAGKDDPYHRDMLSRVTLEEINYPCPVMCEWPALIQARVSQEGGENAISSKYRELVEADLIVDNPLNDNRHAFMVNIEHKLEARTNLHQRYLDLLSHIEDTGCQYLVTKYS